MYIAMNDINKFYDLNNINNNGLNECEIFKK